MISIVIPTYKRAEMLRSHVNAVLENTSDLDFEVIIVNDCKDEEVKPESNWTEKVRIVNNPKSGVASARNFGAQTAMHDWLLFLDDDMLMNRSNLETYLKHCNSEIRKTINLDWEYTPEIIIMLRKKAFGRFLIKHGFTTLRGWCSVAQWEQPVQELEGLTSQNLLIHRSVFSELNGYNETFPFAGAEDFEFAKRAKKAGVVSYVDTTSVMYHNELDRLNEKDWFARKKRGGATQRIAYNLGYTEVFIPDSKKFHFPKLLNLVSKTILSVSSTTKVLDGISFKGYKALLGQNLHSGFYHYQELKR